MKRAQAGKDIEGPKDAKTARHEGCRPRRPHERGDEGLAWIASTQTDYPVSNQQYQTRVRLERAPGSSKEQRTNITTVIKEQHVSR